MKRVLHRFLSHVPSPDTEVLILGTFNPGIPDGPDFFYSRSRNYLWQLLPGCWGLATLKGEPLEKKKSFMAAHKIDFVDLIASVNVPENEIANVDDRFIDKYVEEWNDIAALISSLKNIKAVYFTRKTFGGIQNIKERIRVIQQHCQENGIRFCLLPTPARFANERKQQDWIDTVIHQSTCNGK